IQPVLVVTGGLLPVCHCGTKVAAKPSISKTKSQRRVAMKKLMTAVFAVLLMCSMSAFAKDSTKKAEKAPAAKTMKLKGIVSDAQCGATIKEGCAQKCVEAGEKMVFVNDADQKVWAVNNQDA